MAQSLEALNDIESVSLYKDEKEKELQKAIADRETVEAERYNLTREILELQRQVKDKQIAKIELDKALNKARANCMTLALEIKRASSKFWNLRNC